MTGKRMLVAVLMGVFVVAAGVLTPYISQASWHKGFPAAAQSAAELGINKDEVAKYRRQGVSPHDLAHAALVAKVSGKTLNEVLALKTLANTWQEVEQAAGVTREQLQVQRRDAMATRLESKLAIPKDDSLELLRQGYQARDIVVAAVLAKDSAKPVAEVLAMKRINNSWQEVAQELGVSDGAYKQSLEKIREAMPGRVHHGGQPGCDRPERG